MATPSAHAWFRPRLEALVRDALADGFDQDTSVAVITDLINGPEFGLSPVPPGEEDWARDLGEPAGLSGEMPGHQDAPNFGGDTQPIDGTNLGHVRGTGSTAGNV